MDIQGAAALGVSTGNIVITTIDAPVLANTTEVETGSTVNGVYLNLEAYATTAAALSNVYMILFKNPGNNIAAPIPNAVGGNDDKRYVIHQEMRMLEQQAQGNPRTIFNGVIVIPKGLRRCGPNDRWSVQLISPGVNINYCLQMIYKEFR